MSPLVLAGVGACGALGAVLRVLVAGGVDRRLGARLPAGILVVNVLGSLALGVVVETVSGDVRTLVATGVIGAFTTFSTLAVDVVLLAARGERRTAILDLSLSLGLGLVALLAGRALGGLP